MSPQCLDLVQLVTLCHYSIISFGLFTILVGGILQV